MTSILEILTAVEFGFKQGEAGHNLEATLQQARVLFAPNPPAQKLQAEDDAP